MSSPSEAVTSVPSEPRVVELYMDSPVRVSLAEFQAVHRAPETEEAKAKREDALAEVQAKLAPRPFGEEGDAMANMLDRAQKEQDAEDAAADFEVAAPEQVYTREMFRTQPHVLHRQLAPLYSARTAGELAAAREATVRNLESLGVFRPGSVQVALLPISGPADALAPPHVQNNLIETVSEDSVRGGLLWRAWAGIRRTVGAPIPSAAAVRRAQAMRASAAAADIDDEEDDEDVSLGGAFVRSPTTQQNAFARSFPEDTSQPFRVVVTARERGTIPRRPPVGFGFNVRVSERGRPETAVDMKAANMMGRAERVEVEYTRGASEFATDHADHNVRVSYAQPDVLSVGSSSSATATANQVHWQGSSCLESRQGVLLSWSNNNGSNLTYELSQRQLHAMTEREVSGNGLVSSLLNPSLLPNSNAAQGGPQPFTLPQFREPSASILAMTHPFSQARQSLKSSLRYSWLASTLDNEAVPLRGWKVASAIEAAGGPLKGQASFVKVEAEVKFVQPLASWLSLAFGVHAAGVRHKLPTPPASTSSIAPRRGFLPPSVFFSDRLFLRNNLFLRGWPEGAVGPRDGHDSLGGDVMLATGVSANFALPLSNLRKHGLRGHVFWNAASVAAVLHPGAAQRAASAPVKLGSSGVTVPGAVVDGFSDVFNASRSSIGVGLIIPVSQNVRMEFNYARRLGVLPGENKNKWLEFGLQMVYT